MALKALFRVFGFGKHSEETKKENDLQKPPPRRHPYDEVSDEQLEQNRNNAPSKQPQNSHPKRVHPYDDVTDEELQAKRKAAPNHGQPAQRVHPYDEVTDEQLEANRSKINQGKGQGQGRPPRRHNYDEINLERTMSKVAKQSAAGESNKPAPSLHYVEVDIQPGAKRSEVSRPAQVESQPVIYSEVRPSNSKDKVVIKG